jgi:hypothetical protein
MRRKLYFCGVLSFAWILVVAFSCVEPYNPPAIKELVDILVVDGFLNSTDSSAEVRLSKAAALSDQSGPQPELNALVQIEDENGNISQLTETGDGRYFIQKMNVNPALKYRLSITRSNDKKYVSDLIELKISPPIDSISWASSIQTKGLEIYANTHDASRNSKYYQWTYVETWEYSAGHYAAYKIKDGVVVPQDENLYRCWISKPSTEILINSTSNLTEDAIRNFRLLTIPLGSSKLNKKYSLKVQQRVLTEEAYDFWLQLKKTTESLGSLFDPLPSQVVGNLTSISDDSEPVLGYFSGGHVSEQRIFISFYELPDELREIFPPYCPVDTIDIALIPSYPDINLIGPDGYPFVTGYLTSGYSGCLDCRDGGGNTERPDFWE